MSAPAFSPSTRPVTTPLSSCTTSTSPPSWAPGSSAPGLQPWMLAKGRVRVPRAQVTWMTSSALAAARAVAGIQLPSASHTPSALPLAGGRPAPSPGSSQSQSLKGRVVPPTVTVPAASANTSAGPLITRPSKVLTVAAASMPGPTSSAAASRTTARQARGRAISLVLAGRRTARALRPEAMDGMGVSLWASQAPPVISLSPVSRPATSD